MSRYAQSHCSPTRTPCGSTRRVLQRKCACGQHTGGGECAECSKKKQELGQGSTKTLQRLPGNFDAETGFANEAPPIVHEVLRSPGHPLDATTRAFFEPRFGHDFSQVRVHADAKAAESARAVNAVAYTVGRDVVFGRNQYAPQASEGKSLLAHELTHTMQQEGRLGRPIGINSPGDRWENEAERAAQVVMSGPGDRSRAAAPHLDVGTSPACVRRLGANPGCTDPERKAVHQMVFNARGWVNRAIPQLEASPLPAAVVRSLRRNFGDTYGVAANAALIAGRLRAAYREMSTIPIGCLDVADPDCAAGHCGVTPSAGAHTTSICRNVTLTAGRDWRFQAGCVLHEAFHAAFSNFAPDEYSGWHGLASPTATYPGGGTDPLLNADSYTTLVMELS